jgi:ArsR family transcriptional regulator, arsenate/arsenite/antimonite-responsive transcriptional repressor
MYTLVGYMCQGEYLFGYTGKGMSPQVTHLEKVFRALADPTRLRLLNLMDGREVCVCYLVEVLNVPQPKISRHLAYLRDVGLVLARREGKWMHYRLADHSNRHFSAILRTTLGSLRREPRMQRDLQKLNSACCGPRSLVQVIGAPLPAKI